MERYLKIDGIGKLEPLTLRAQQEVSTPVLDPKGDGPRRIAVVLLLDLYLRLPLLEEGQLDRIYQVWLNRDELPIGGYSYHITGVTIEGYQRRSTLTLSLKAEILEDVEGPLPMPHDLFLWPLKVTPTPVRGTIYILAGSPTQAASLANREGLWPSNVVYVSSPDKLHGVRGGILWVYGDGVIRDDSERILQLAAVNGMEVVYK